ncbi:MAG: hypothetical protein FD126_1420 [Elusimicrobia bacterium]|nr:MAG: hypothetical protein FD126_1420 [Elusimicrobiota bacterium]
MSPWRENFKSAVAVGLFLAMAAAPFFALASTVLRLGWPACAGILALALGVGAFFFAASAFTGANWLESLIPAGIMFTLVLVAVPKFQELLRRSREVTALETLDRARETPGFPPVRVPPYHPTSAAVRRGAAPDDAGGWLVTASTPSVYVNCTHTDFKGRLWSKF